MSPVFTKGGGYSGYGNYKPARAAASSSGLSANAATPAPRRPLLSFTLGPIFNVEGVALLGRVRDLLARVDPDALAGDLERDVLLERVLEDQPDGASARLDLQGAAFPMAGSLSAKNSHS